MHIKRHLVESTLKALEAAEHTGVLSDSICCLLRCLENGSAGGQTHADVVRSSQVEGFVDHSSVVNDFRCAMCL
jgi:hypothetical protein